MSDVRISEFTAGVTLPGGGTIYGKPITVTPLMPWSGKWADPEAPSYSEVARSYYEHNYGKERTIYQFKGIPYAYPPVGDRRWKPAEYMQRPLNDPFIAQSWGRIPWQTESVLDGRYEDDYPSRPRNGIGNGHFEWTTSYWTTFDENCLTLNIWTPDLDPTTPLPVVVYIHGGGFVQNTSCMFATNGDFIATKGIVYVTIEYRLSTFGFFYHPSFAGEDGVKGNLALTDQQAALQWVYDNIPSFGGDQDNVTIMGSSAGGASVLAHMETAEHNLFQKAWVTSGGGQGYRTKLTGTDTMTAEQRGLEFARWKRNNAWAHSDPTRQIQEIESEDGIADALRLGPSPHHILGYSNARLGRQGLSSGDSTTITNIGSDNVYPFNDGTFLTYDRSAECFLAAAEKDIPLVIGYATNEASVIGTKVLAPPPLDQPDIDNCRYNARAGLVSILDVDSSTALTNIYPDLDPEVEDEYTEIKRRAYRDIVYGHASRTIAAAHVATNPATWWYCWDYVPQCFERDEDSERFTDPSVMDRGVLAGHTSDITFWLGTIDWAVKLYVEIGEAAVNIAELVLSEWMMQRLANFAKNGNVNTAYDNSDYDFDLFSWEDSPYPETQWWHAYTVGNKNALLISNNEARTWYTMTKANNHMADVYDYFDEHLNYD